MNILYICHRFPFPPKRGGKIRPFNMIRHLNEQGHNIWVASLARSASEREECEGIEEYCHDYFCSTVNELAQTARMALRLPLPTPSSMGYFFSHELKQHIDQLLQNNDFDLIFVHCSSVAQYVQHVQGIPKILDFGDMDSQKWLSYTSFKPFPLNYGYWWEGQKMLRAEKKLAAQFDMCTATTRMEWETLSGFEVSEDTDWFPNGVDANYFSPSEEKYNTNAISFIGRMDYYPNQQSMLEFCSKTLPLIKEIIPDVQLFIVGADPSEAIKRLEDIPGVTVTGSVPDVRPYVRQTAAMVAPLNIARGTQNKILEAMSMGVPVVSSTSAAGGIDAIAGQHFLVAKKPHEYCKHLVELMQNADHRASFSVAGRARVLSNHNWRSSMQRMDRIIARCVENSSVSTTFATY